MSYDQPMQSGSAASDGVALDRDSPIPLYLQIKQYLARRISAWEPQDDKFFTDAELCGMFHVSRMTVRQAVQELVDDGLLKRARGIGTFLVSRRGDEPATPAIDDRWEAEGRPVELEVLGYETQPCPREFAGDLALAPDAAVRYIFRLRKAGGVAFALDHCYIPLAFATGITQADAAGTLIQRFWDRYDMGDAEFRLEASVAGPQEQRWLELPPGAPVMMRRLRFLTRDGLAVIAGRTVYRADLVRYAFEMPLSRDTAEPVQRGEDHDRVVRLRREMVAPHHS